MNLHWLTSIYNKCYFIKNICENFQQIYHREDYKINKKRVEVFRNSVLIQEKWGEIGVGDIIRIKNNEVFPADIVVLSSRYSSNDYLIIIIITRKFSVNSMEIVI